MAKPSLGFSTQKAAREAIRRIVHQYGVDQEFFDPLLQRLFIERPYWCDPPGPTFIKFKWISQELPNGATTDRWMTGRLPDQTWMRISFNRAISGRRATLSEILGNWARDLASPIVSKYHDLHPFCEHCPAYLTLSDHVHHTTPMADIIKVGIAKLTDAQKADILAQYANRFGVNSFVLPDSHPFSIHVLEQHQQRGLLVALCTRHHNSAHGKQTHNA
jgi:hypothetical protein